MTDEPVITVNGQLLSVGQAMAVRVAVAAFSMQIKQEGLGTDSHGRAMASAYTARCDEVLSLMALNEELPL